MFSKIIFLIFIFVFSAGSCAETLLLDIPHFDSTKIGNVGLTEMQAKSLLVLSLKNEKYNVSRPGIFMDDDLKDKQGKAFHPGYYTFGVGYDSPSAGATDIWGMFSISPKTGDVWEEYTCTQISFPELQKIQQIIIKKTGVTFADEVAQRRGLGCKDE